MFYQFCAQKSKFRQILDFFAQMCVFAASAFRSSVTHQKYFLKKQRRQYKLNNIDFQKRRWPELARAVISVFNYEKKVLSIHQLLKKTSQELRKAALIVVGCQGVKVFLTKRCHYNYFCHYCHFYYYHNLSF